MMFEYFKENYPLEYKRLRLLVWAAVLIFLIPYNYYILVPMIIFFGLLVLPLPTAIVASLALIISLFWLSF